MSKRKRGYHLSEIPRGTVGEFSKIEEEIAEARDAVRQNCRVMILMELSDAIGAMDAYLRNHFAGAVTIDDLLRMAVATGRAFDAGERQ